MTNDTTISMKLRKNVKDAALRLRLAMNEPNMQKNNTVVLNNRRKAGNNQRNIHVVFARPSQ